MVYGSISGLHYPTPSHQSHDPTGTVADIVVDNRAHNTFSFFFFGSSRLLSFMFMYVLPIQDALMRWRRNFRGH